MRCLRDTSISIALLDASHIHYRLTAQWLQTHGVPVGPVARSP